MSERSYPTSPSPDPRGAYRAFRTIGTRWMDNDAYGHVNNVVYYSWFDTVVNAHLIEQGALDIHHGEVIGLVIETQCNYFSSIEFPQSVEAGLRVAHIGRSSVRYEVGLFAQGQPLTAAKGHFVHVYVDRATRRPVALARKAQIGPGGLEVPGQHRDQDPASVDAAIESRFSTRAFLPQPVPRETINDILRVAAAPHPAPMPALEGLRAAGILHNRLHHTVI